MSTIARRSTIQAFRQRIYGALTSPTLAYSINGGSPIDLPAANVVPKLLWEIGQLAPMPLVAFAVEGKGDAADAIGRAAQGGFRILRLYLWVVSAEGLDEVTSIYEAIRSRIDYADQDAPPGVTDLSIAGTGGSSQPITIQQLRELEARTPYYETETKRWYLPAEYYVSAL